MPAGRGTITAGSSGAFTALPVTIASRIGDPEGKTSPEELLAAAHAGCYITSLGSELARAGTPPERLEVRCVITMDEVAGQGHRIVLSEIHARGVVPDADAETFARVAEAADEGCSFSALIRASAAVTISARLEEGDIGMATDRTANVTWQGSLMDGAGTIDSVGSGSFGPLDVSWAARTEQPGGKTSPEELVAAAWASCYSMALSHALAQAGSAPERLETSATVTFQPGEGITKGHITVRGTVPGIDAAAFQEQAEGAVQNCPVSKALAGIPEVTLEATLA